MLEKDRHLGDVPGADVLVETGRLANASERLSSADVPGADVLVRLDAE